MLGAGVKDDRAGIIASLTAMRDDPDLLVERASAGLAALASCSEVGRPVGVIGYCFGGMAALALARSGAELDAAVCVHGTLGTVRPARAGQLRARVLVCAGAADPHVPMGDVVEFAREMEEADAEWELILYGRAVHGFTHADAQPGVIPGVAYSRVADERSFDAISHFLEAVPSTDEN